MLITLPKVKQYDIAGCEPLIINRSDVVSKKAWYNLTVNNSPYLGVEDFFDYELYTKYFYVTTGLLDYAMTIIYGDEGGGKSLVMNWLTFEFLRLFGKRCVLGFTPPNPSIWGDYYDFSEEDFRVKIQTEMNILESVERQAKREGKRLSKEAYKHLIIHNSTVALDESDSIADKANQTNLTKFVGRVIRRRRHSDTCIFMAYVDLYDVPLRLIGKRATHQIECAKDMNRKGWCVYTILTTKNRENAKAGTRKLLHLDPSALTWLWDSKQSVGISHEQDIYLGGKKHKESRGNDLENN